MGKIRYGVVGAGWIAQEAFMPAVPKTENSSVTAIVSGSADRAQGLADRYRIGHVFSYEEYDRLLSSDLVDALYIALPNEMHAEFASRALRAGKHVLVEKPLAISEAECQSIIDAANEGKAFLLTAYRLHNEPGTVDVIERVRSGEIGDPRVFSAVFTSVIGNDNHRLSASHWGGPLQDVGVYCLNMARHVFGDEPIAVSAIASHGDDDARFREVPESIAAILQFPKGRIAQFIVSFNASDVDRYTVAGTKGSLKADPGFRFETPNRLTLEADGKIVPRNYPKVDQFAGMVAYFSDCILTGTLPHVGTAEGLADVRVLRAIERAAATGQIQRLEPFRTGGRVVRRMIREIV